METKPQSQAKERRAVVRIDAEPSGKKFQGVWLEFSDGKKWVVDYRPRDLWKSFEDKEVIVTGECYQPFGQAINAPHFRVDTMKFVTPKRGFGPLLELGPEQELRGKFIARAFEEGTKMAGSSQRFFVEDGGTSHMIQGASVTLEMDKPVSIQARGVTPDYSFVATTTSDRPKLWILDVRAHDYVKDETTAPKPKPCPD